MNPNQNLLSRRGFIKTALSAMVASFLAACKPRNVIKVYPSPSLTPPPTSYITPTIIPSPSPVATSSFIPFSAVRDISFPPDNLFTPPMSVRDMTYELRRDALNSDAPPLVFARSLSQPRALLTAHRVNGSWEWHPTWLRDFADTLALRIGVLLDQNGRNVLHEFNSGTATNSWNGTGQPQSASTFDYSCPDRQVEIARLSNITVPDALRLQHIVNQYEVPTWLTKSSPGREGVIAALRWYVTNTMNHFKDVIGQYSVVNEPSGGNGYLYEVLGQDYITLAFESARTANPSATLLLNETRNHSIYEPNTYPIRILAEKLSSKGLVDAIGVQMHLLQCPGQVPPQEDDVVATMKSYGLPVYVTELDVNLTTTYIANQTERYKFQAGLYSTAVRAAVKSGVCKGISFWGSRDGDSWLQSDPVCGSLRADPTMWDDSYQPKPAYWAVWDVLMAAASELKPMETYKFT